VFCGKNWQKSDIPLNKIFQLYKNTNLQITAIISRVISAGRGLQLFDHKSINCSKWSDTEFFKQRALQPISMMDKNDTDPVSPTESGNFIEPAPMRWTLRLIFIVVFIVGVIGNSVVCVAVIRRKRMRTSNNIFTFNLALCDLLNVLIFLPTQMAAFENDHNWATGDFMCHFTYILVPVSLSASIGTLLAITSDRYRAIAYPMKPRLSGKKVKIILAIIWITSLIICSPLIFVAGEQRPAPGKVYCDEEWPEPIYSKIYWNFIFVIQYVLPLAIIVVLAVLIAVKIRQNNAMQMLPKSSQVIAAAVRQRMKQTSKITNMLIALVILYAVCMLPQHIVFLWYTYGNLAGSKYFIYVLRFANVFPMANSALNPIAYGTLNKEFKKVYKSFFNCECYKTDTDVYKASPKSINRIRTGKFRLAVYKRENDVESSSSECEKRRRKSNSSSVASSVTTKKMAKWKKNDDKEMKVRTAVPNGYQTLPKNHTQSSTLSHGPNQGKVEDEQRHVKHIPIKADHSRSQQPPDHSRGKEEEQLLLNNGMVSEYDRDGSLKDEHAELKAQPQNQKTETETTAHRDANIYGKELDSNKLHLKENLKTQLLTKSDFENDSFMNCWVEVTKIDKKLLSYLKSLKETDL